MKLKKEDFKDAVGRCQGCGEMTSVVHPCCDAAVEYEGSSISWIEFEEEE